MSENASAKDNNDELWGDFVMGDSGLEEVRASFKLTSLTLNGI